MKRDGETDPAPASGVRTLFRDRTLSKDYRFPLIKCRAYPRTLPPSPRRRAPIRTLACTRPYPCVHPSVPLRAPVRTLDPVTSWTRDRRRRHRHKISFSGAAPEKHCTSDLSLERLQSNPVRKIRQKRGRHRAGGAASNESGCCVQRPPVRGEVEPYLREPSELTNSPTNGQVGPKKNPLELEQKMGLDPVTSGTRDRRHNKKMRSNRRRRKKIHSNWSKKTTHSPYYVLLLRRQGVTPGRSARSPWVGNSSAPDLRGMPFDLHHTGLDPSTSGNLPWFLAEV